MPAAAAKSPENAVTHTSRPAKIGDRPARGSADHNAMEAYVRVEAVANRYMVGTSRSFNSSS